MAISEHPVKGTLLLCDFSQGFCPPEMVKRRPVIVLSPKIVSRVNLCTVVALSTTSPDPIMPYHAKIDLPSRLPKHFQREGVWIKGDMINTVGFHRLDLIRIGKNLYGSRQYLYDTLTDEQMRLVQACILNGMGLQNLTKQL